MIEHSLDLWQQALPSFELAITLGPVLLLWGMLVGWLAGTLRQRWQIRTPYTRKIFHFTIFTSAGVCQLIWGLPGVALLGMIVSSLVLVAVFKGRESRLFDALARPTDAPHQKLFIVVPLITTALGGILSNLLFAPFAFVGYLACGWGDAVGEPVGTRWGKHRYRVPSLVGVAATRSLEGSTAVFTVSWIASAGGLLAAGFAPVTCLLAGFLCGVTSALVEAISNHGLDNLTVQVAASAAAFLLLAF